MGATCSTCSTATNVKFAHLGDPNSKATIEKKSIAPTPMPERAAPKIILPNNNNYRLDRTSSLLPGESPVFIPPLEGTKSLSQIASPHSSASVASCPEQMSESSYECRDSDNVIQDHPVVSGSPHINSNPRRSSGPLIVRVSGPPTSTSGPPTSSSSPPTSGHRSPPHRVKTSTSVSCSWDISERSKIEYKTRKSANSITLTTDIDE